MKLPRGEDRNEWLAANGEEGEGQLNGLQLSLVLTKSVCLHFTMFM